MSVQVQPIFNPSNKKLGGATGKGFMPGQSGNPGGKAKGIKNKILVIKEAICNAFNEKNFLEWCKKHPTEFYQLMIKIMPKELELSGKDGGAIAIADAREKLISKLNSIAPDGASKADNK